MVDISNEDRIPERIALKVEPREAEVNGCGRRELAASHGSFTPLGA
ncbi:hypothetical protein [Streptomyces justiciae]|uniref:Uncharacterized protein n=1 Tax=Streptomyces justiciae TaxID=2780140 RepID=A0ABU3LN89_9ACTN|nr:hypothetical protein [Streptomyces justiciae]MDT7840707.1 hypothetical protein [Streptomyces justiciae]